MEMDRRLPRPLPLRLYMVKGSFFASADDGAAMDARVWSRLPQELMWAVMQFVPAATYFRLQSVSRKWRHVLTSKDFRNTYIAAARAAARVPAGRRGWEEEGEEEEDCDREQQQLRVDARVRENSYTNWTNSGSKIKVVDIDLSTLVPASFWPTVARAAHFPLYSVVAAGDGLVCISNTREARGMDRYRYEREVAAWEPGKTRYCVLNPLTRTCRELPPLPFKPRWWLPPTSTAITIFSYTREPPPQVRWILELRVATYDLAGGGRGGGGRWDLASTCMCTFSLEDPDVVVCAGRVYVHSHPEVQVLVPCGDGGPGGGRQLRIQDSMAEPSATAALPAGMDMDDGDAPSWSCGGIGGGEAVVDRANRPPMLVHRGTVFFIKALRRSRGVDVVMHVYMWRRTRRGFFWEPVACLDCAQLERLTGLECVSGKEVTCDAWSACGAQGLLYCTVQVDWKTFMLGLDLDTGAWELVHDDEKQHLLSLAKLTKGVELRPDLFL